MSQNKTTNKKATTTNKTRFLNGEPFKIDFRVTFFKYSANTDLPLDKQHVDPGYMLEISVDNDGYVLMERYESNISKIGPTTCSAFVFVLGKKVQVCLRYDSLDFDVIIKEKHSEEKNIERIGS